MNAEGVEAFVSHQHLILRPKSWGHPFCLNPSHVAQPGCTGADPGDLVFSTGSNQHSIVAQTLFATKVSMLQRCPSPNHPSKR